MIENLLLSKVLDTGTINELTRHNIDAMDFYTIPEVYKFVKDYVQKYGQTPDCRTVSAEFENFEYYPEVADSFQYLCQNLKAQAIKRQAFELLSNDVGKKYSELSGEKFIEYLSQEVTRIKQENPLAVETAHNFAYGGEERLTWYIESKENRSGQYIPTPYPGLTAALGGGFELGDYILLMAFTNRGKSWISSHIGVTANDHNFGVLHYSPELSKQQQAFRLDTLKGHFDNVKLRRGELENEQVYMNYLKQFNEDEGKAPYIIKTMEDLPRGLSLEVIESDLAHYENIQMVVIDGFNLMVHGNGKMRDSMTQTSRKLRQLFGRYKVAGLVVHQTPGSAERESQQEGDDGLRVVKPPKLTDYSETIAVIQDAATALTFDAANGDGKISVEKAREPSVGKIIDLNIDFNRGYITEKMGYVF